MGTMERNAIAGPGFRFEGTHTVVESALMAGPVVVIYDHMEFEPGRPARNLFCYDTSGHELWRAADIGQGATDAYSRIVTKEPLVVGNFAGFAVTIDPETGAVVATVYTK